MVKASLKKVFVKNFKSLHDCEIDIGKMNVVVGANASGKSNLIEVFRLLKKIYVDKDINPFSEWWGYNNVVWQRREELSIIIGLLFEIEGYIVYFETTFTGVGGKFQILREILEIRDYVKIEKEGGLLTVKHDNNFIKNLIKNLPLYEISHGGKKILKMEKEHLTNATAITTDFNQRLFEYKPIYFSEPSATIFEKGTKKKQFLLSPFPSSIKSFQKNEKGNRLLILCPTINKKDVFPYTPIYEVVLDAILSTINNLMILNPLNIRSMKSPQPFRREENIKEDGTNIASIYHTIYLKEGKIPEEIYNPLSMIFPKIDVRPHLTDDGRVMIKFFEDGLELLPPNTSDGFYKILTMFIAIYLKPPLLIVDEIENSLHPSTLELILNTIKIGDTQAIITTHSPVVVDMTELSNIILVENELGESKFKRIKDPEKVRGFLIEKGITFSEGWIYGDLLKTEKQA